MEENIQHETRALETHKTSGRMMMMMEMEWTENFSGRRQIKVQTNESAVPIYTV